MKSRGNDSSSPKWNITSPSLWGLAGCWAAILLLEGVPLVRADRCSDARDDILRAKQMDVSTQVTQARSLLMSAFVACPANPQNLELLAEAYDLLGDLVFAGKFREQAMRLRGISSKPVITFSASSYSIEKGQTADLHWAAQYATDVELTPDFGRVAATGTKTVAPGSTTSYKLTAKGPDGLATIAIEIAVTIPRLTEENIVDLLMNGVPKPHVAQLVNERGIKFEPTEAVQQRLRKAGADDPIIEAVRKAHH